MQEDEQYQSAVEALLEDIIANQHSLHATLAEVYAKIQTIELQLGAAAPEDEYAMEEAVDALYDQAYACAETGVHVSVPYLIRELQTNAAVAHELIERLRIDGMLEGQGSSADTEDGNTDVFTTIDLKEINADTPTETASVTDIFDAARDFVVAEQSCSQAALMKALTITQTEARAVLAELEAAGIVSESQGRKGRTVLVAE